MHGGGLWGDFACRVRKNVRSKRRLDRNTELLDRSYVRGYHSFCQCAEFGDDKEVEGHLGLCDPVVLRVHEHSSDGHLCLDPREAILHCIH